MFNALSGKFPVESEPEIRAGPPLRSQIEYLSSCTFGYKAVKQDVSRVDTRIGVVFSGCFGRFVPPLSYGVKY